MTGDPLALFVHTLCYAAGGLVLFAVVMMWRGAGGRRY